jgi:hypothetical protein
MLQTAQSFQQPLMYQTALQNSYYSQGLDPQGYNYSQGNYPSNYFQNYANNSNFIRFAKGGTIGKKKSTSGEDNAGTNRNMKAQEEEFKAIMFDNELLQKSLIKVFK